MVQESIVKQELARGAGLSIITLVNALIEESLELRASDIHIDPTTDDVTVRMRIDGVLQDAYVFPKSIHSEIISRIKILAGLRTDEHQVPQDGRFRVAFKDEEPIDIRVSIVPVYYGENAALRLLAEHAEKFTLATLGLSSSDLEKIERAMRRPNGMILVTGPTGSGKTTTLYTMLKKLHTKDVAIITIEDPIEYAIKGMNQMQVNARAGLTFANGLRSILRQDPDIIMVGEIRDAETAGLAVNTALTGHLVLSTLHTNDAATTLPRLLDLGMEPYLIAATVNVVIGQRLVRKICDACKVKHSVTPAEQRRLSELAEAAPLATQQLWRGKGCDACNGSGFRGRLGIYEVIPVDDAVREAMLRKASASEISQIAHSQGMTTMSQDGFAKVAQGLTTLSEVLRVTHE